MTFVELLQEARKRGAPKLQVWLLRDGDLAASLTIAMHECVPQVAKDEAGLCAKLLAGMQRDLR